MVRKPPWHEAELSDAGAVFLVVFGLLVFAQLALDALDGQLRMAEPGGAALTVVVALVGAGLVAIGWRVHLSWPGTSRRRRRAGADMPVITEAPRESSEEAGAENLLAPEL